MGKLRAATNLILQPADREPASRRGRDGGEDGDAQSRTDLSPARRKPWPSRWRMQLAGAANSC